LTYFAQNLKHLRKRHARTQEQLGQEIKLGRTTIANYEAGLSSPTDPEILVRLSHVFGISIDELLTRDLAVAFGNGVAQPKGVESAGPLSFFGDKMLANRFAAGTSPDTDTSEVVSGYWCARVEPLPTVLEQRIAQLEQRLRDLELPARD
jgi:transcriptional regulator with XRE-family HTH domain